MFALGIAVSILVIGWLFGSLLAWIDFRQDWDDAPFSWRVFCGPVVYFNWLERIGKW
jgi:hypothetical protein